MSLHCSASVLQEVPLLVIYQCNFLLSLILCSIQLYCILYFCCLMFSSLLTASHTSSRVWIFSVYENTWVALVNMCTTTAPAPKPLRFHHPRLNIIPWWSMPPGYHWFPRHLSPSNVLVTRSGSSPKPLAKPQHVYLSSQVMSVCSIQLKRISDPKGLYEFLSATGLCLVPFAWC